MPLCTRPPANDALGGCIGCARAASAREPRCAAVSQRGGRRVEKWPLEGHLDAYRDRERPFLDASGSCEKQLPRRGATHAASAHRDASDAEGRRRARRYACTAMKRRRAVDAAAAAPSGAAEQRNFCTNTYQHRSKPHATRAQPCAVSVGAAAADQLRSGDVTPAAPAQRGCCTPARIRTIWAAGRVRAASAASQANGAWVGRAAVVFYRPRRRPRDRRGRQRPGRCCASRVLQQLAALRRQSRVSEPSGQ